MTDTDDLIPRAEAEAVAYKLAAEKLAEALQEARERIVTLATEVERLQADIDRIGGYRCNRCGGEVEWIDAISPTPTEGP